MSAKDKIYEYLITHNNRATNAELAELLRGQPGQLSFGQRIREIRKEVQAKGQDLTCKELRPGIYLYEIVVPQAPLFEREQGQYAFI